MSYEYDPAREDILDNFALEEGLDEALLREYQLNYPELADELLELYYMLTSERPTAVASETTAEEIAFAEAAWQRYVEAAPEPATTDPFAALSVSQQQNIARMLGLPLQVLAAFQEHKIEISTVPEAFLRRLATAMRQPLSRLQEFFAGPPPMVLGKSYKADAKPVSTGPVEFRALLEKLGLSDTEIDELLSEAA